MKCPDCGAELVREARPLDMPTIAGSPSVLVTAWWCTCGQSVHDGAALQVAERVFFDRLPHMLSAGSFVVCGERDADGAPMLCRECAFRAWARVRVSQSPDVMGGEPVIRGTRLTIQHLGGLLARRVPEAALLADYPYLTPDDLKHAPEFASATAAEKRRLFADIAEGLASIDRGERTYTTAEVRERLMTRRVARRLAKVATPGPWRVEGDQFDCPVVTGPNGERIADCDGSEGAARSAANATLIVALRALIEDES